MSAPARLLPSRSRSDACAEHPAEGTRPPRWERPDPRRPRRRGGCRNPPRNVDVALVERAPATLAPVALPMGVTPAPGSTPTAAAFVARDARFYVVDAYGVASPVERRTGDTVGPMESPPTPSSSSPPTSPPRSCPDGALVVREERAAGAAPATARRRAGDGAGDESLWATGAGVFTTQGALAPPRPRRRTRHRRDRARSGPARGATRDAWVLRARPGSFPRLRVTPGAGDGGGAVVRPGAGLTAGNVRAIATYGAHRYTARRG